MSPDQFVTQLISEDDKLSRESVGRMMDVSGATGEAPIIDLSKRENIELLQAELTKVFPDAARYLYPAERVSYEDHNGIVYCWLAFSQEAWRDVSWGWISRSLGRSSIQQRPCPIGGVFARDSVSIGD